MKRKTFLNKNILITGASSGIGYALGLELANHGANCILTARRKERLDELEEKIRSDGGQAISSVVDVTNDAELKRVVNQTHNEFGLIDVVIANAAIPMHGNFDQLSTKEFRQIFETNVFGVLNTAYACIDDLKKNNGTLVLMGSVMAYMATPGTSAYSMGKFAIRAFAETIHNELAQYGINVVLINPGFVKSEIRLVDNRGVYDSNRKDWVPSFLVMSAEKAARKITKAIYKRKRQKFIGLNGYVGYWFRQYMPWLYFRLLNMGNRIVRSGGKE